MSIACIWSNRRLSRLAILGQEPDSRLTAHLNRCAVCTEAWASYRALAGQLECGLELPRLPQHPVIAFRKPAPRALCLAPAAGFGLALLILTGTPEIRQMVPASRSSDSGVVVRVSTRPKRQRQGLELAAIRGAQRESMTLARTGRKHGLRHQDRLCRNSTPLTCSPAIYIRPVTTGFADLTTPAERADCWKRVGRIYEESGNYPCAAAAYKCGLREEPDPELTYSAARASECSGQVGDAVALYSRLLKQPEPIEPTKPKGQSRWYEDLWPA